MFPVVYEVQLWLPPNSRQPGRWWCTELSGRTWTADADIARERCASLILGGETAVVVRVTREVIAGTDPGKKGVPAPLAQ